MKDFSWTAVLNVFNKFVRANVEFEGVDKLHSSDLKNSFLTLHRMTDDFHPWNSDFSLARALKKMPERCNYRNIESYWAWKNGREELEAALFEMIQEVFEIIEDYYSNKWNHPPGYKPPVKVKFDNHDNDKAIRRLAGQIIRAAKI